MKIHIVQKGDTLWKIAQKYGVDFNELKLVNTQLSNPDMIMPGMKIKIPTGSVPVKKHGNPHSKEEVTLSQLAPKEVPKQVSPAQMPSPTPAPVAPKEMPLPTPAPVAPKEMPVPTPVLPKEMPKVVSPAVTKEVPIQLPPIPQMPVEQPEIDYNIEQNMYNYTFNIPTFPIKEAPVKEMPEVVAGVSKEEPVAPPTLPAQPLPEAPAAYPCVPITGLMPGSGLPCGYYPMPCPPFPCPPVAVPYGMQPIMQPFMQPQAYNPALIPQQPTAVSPAMFDDENDGSEQMYPGLTPMSAPASPVGPMTAAGGDCGCGGPKMDPAAFGSMPAGYGGVPAGFGGMPGGFGGAPTGFGGMPGGYGGVPAGFGGMPSGFGGAPTGFGGMPGGFGGAPTGFSGMPGGYGGAPVGFSGMPGGYGGVPTGFSGMPAGYGGMPAGVAGVPSGYGSAPESYMGVPTGFSGTPTTGFGAMPTGFGAPQGGYGGMPMGFEMPAGFGVPQAGPTGAQTQAPQGTFAPPPEFPFAQFQTQMSPTNSGEPSFRYDELDDEEDDW